jgi:hypothetical protein
MAGTTYWQGFEKRIVVEAAVLGKKIWEPGKRKHVDTKMSKMRMRQMNMRRTPSRCPSWSFQTKWSAGRVMERMLNQGEE